MIPSWILDIFAVVMLMVAAVSAARLVAARAWSHAAADTDIDVAHVLMGLAMAGMLAVGLRTLSSAAWAVIFAVATVWFGWRVIAELPRRRLTALGESHHLPHLVHGAAMVYMFVAVTGMQSGTSSAMGGMASASSGMGTVRVPAVAFVFILFMAGWAVWDIDQLSGSAFAHASGAGRPAFALAGIGRPLTLATAVSGQADAVSGADTKVAASSVDADQALRGSVGQATATPAETGAGPVTARGAVATQLTDPRVAIGCRIAMSVTMALMLVLMI